MASINPLIDFEALPTTRQTLFDMWSGALTGIGLDDFAEGFIPTLAGSTFSDVPGGPQPGQLFWHLSENVMYVFTDEVDGTGVSLWLALGPDKFETAMLAAEPIPAAYPVELMYDRYVRIDRTNTQGDGANSLMPRVIGFNQSGINTPVDVNVGRLDMTDATGVTTYGQETAASGAWIRVGVDGLLYGKLEIGASHVSEGFTTFTIGRHLSLSNETGRAPSLFGHTAPNTFMGIGYSTQWSGSAAAPTEPSWILKFGFAPRCNRTDDFRD